MEDKNSCLLILTLSFGMGHVSAAQSVAEGWRSEIGSDVVVWDGVEHFPFWFRLLYVLPYWWMIRYCPWLWRRLFQARVKKMHRQTVPHTILKRASSRLLNEISELKPRVILAAEVGACEIGALYKSSLDPHVLLAALVTDFESEPVWVQRGVDLYLVPSQKVARDLRRWGAPAHRLRVVGIPVRSGFETPIKKESARAALGVHPDLPVILMMAGGMGPCHLDQVATELDSMTHSSLHLVAVAGHDIRLLARLKKLRLRHADLIVRGWVDNVPQYMAAADLLITKPGALTLSEARAMSLPTIVMEPIPGPEEENMCQWVRSGAGLAAENPRDAARLALSLLERGVERPFICSDHNPEKSVKEIIRHLKELADSKEAFNFSVTLPARSMTS